MQAICDFRCFGKETSILLICPRFFPVSNPVNFPIQALAADFCVAAFSA
jgi:hypothetical protein